MTKFHQVKLNCDQRLGCQDLVTHVDNKGWVYCARHAKIRKGCGLPNRKLKPKELTVILGGLSLSKY